MTAITRLNSTHFLHRLMTDKFYPLQITMLPKQAGVKILRFQLLSAMPRPKALKVCLTWRSCLACWDSTMDVSTHTVSRDTHPIPSLHATAPSSGSESAGKAPAHKKGGQRMRNCSGTEQPCSPHLQEHHRRITRNTQHRRSNTSTSEKQEIRFIISLKNLLDRADSATNESFLYIKDNTEIGLFFFTAIWG